MLQLIDCLEPVTIFEIEGDEVTTKRRLIDAGERLMGRHGIQTPSLYEIALEAGQANKFAVQYYFGNRAGLIEAIFALRMRRINQRRQYCVQRMDALGLQNDLASILEAIFVPLSEQIDESGRHSYARLLLQYASRLDYDPADPDDPFNARRELVIALLCRAAAIVDVRPDEFEFGFTQQHSAMVTGLVARDNYMARGQPVPSIADLIDQTIVMAVPALHALGRRLAQPHERRVP